MWLTDPMASDFVITHDSTLNRDATLVFFSKTINSAQQQGKICAWMFVRPPSGADIPLPGSPFQYPLASWPQAYPSNGTPLAMDMGGSQTVPAGSQLGLAVSVGDRNDTPAALEFMFDHPTYPARLEVQTTTPLG
jgi:hypothetical protein